jgi:hypothetical protein
VTGHLNNFFMKLEVRSEMVHQIAGLAKKPRHHDTPTFVRSDFSGPGKSCCTSVESAKTLPGFEIAALTKQLSILSLAHIGVVARTADEHPIDHRLNRNHGASIHTSKSV